MRRLASAILAAIVVAALTAPAAVAGQSGGSDGGEPTLDESSGRAPKPSGDYRDTIADAVADIQAYWADEFPALYGERYTPIPKSRVIAAHPGVKLPSCGGQRGTYADVEGNAAYVPCPGKPLVVYDDYQLFPGLDRDFGGLAVPLVLAHEWGHAIQDQAGTIDNRLIVVELQADCFAGSWLARVANGDAPRVSIQSGNLDSALAAVLNFADPIGLTEDVDPNAHGSGFDRTSAFQQGFDEGAAACSTYFDSPPLIVEIPFTDPKDAASGGNLPPRQVIPASVRLLNRFYSTVEPAYERKTLDDVYSYDARDERNLPTCGDEPLDASDVANLVYYCIPDGTFGFDEPYLQHIYDDVGDYGVVTLLAYPFAVYVETLQQPETFEENVALGDCYTGGFTAALWNNEILSPGDLDEAIAAYADFSVAHKTADLDATFERIRAFRDGFLNGYETCASYQSAGSSG